jgi:hypothetical protein
MIQTLRRIRDFTSSDLTRRRNLTILFSPFVDGHRCLWHAGVYIYNRSIYDKTIFSNSNCAFHSLVLFTRSSRLHLRFSLSRRYSFHKKSLAIHGQGHLGLVKGALVWSKGLFHFWLNVWLNVSLNVSLNVLMKATRGSRISEKVISLSHDGPFSPHRLVERLTSR